VKPRIPLLLLLLALPAAGIAQVYVPPPPGSGEHTRVRFADSLLSINDMCLVSHRALDILHQPIYVNLRPVAFCCAPCPGKFDRHPARYLAALGQPIPCVVHPYKPAVIDSASAVFLNHDVFFFSDSSARATFLADPLHYATRLTDPVTLARFAPSARSPHLVYHDRAYYFADSSTYQQFQSLPDNYAVRGGARAAEQDSSEE